MKDWKQNLKFRCTGCGNCCKEPIVVVSDADVRRVQKHTGQSAEKIVGFYGPDDLSWRKSWSGWVKLKQGRLLMGLRRTWDQCQYLRQDRCTIYEHRPIACRKWPFDVTMDDTGKIHNLQISDEIECPYELDGHNTRREIKKVFAWDERQDDAYFKKVKRWNARPRPGHPKEFLRFLELEVH